MARDSAATESARVRREGVTSSAPPLSLRSAGELGAERGGGFRREAEGLALAAEQHRDAGVGQVGDKRGEALARFLPAARR